MGSPPFKWCTVELDGVCLPPLLTLRGDVTVELKKLLDAGIIERVDASPRISNLVVTKKKTGGLRPCADLRQVNKAVIPDKYPLPTVEELSAKFHRSTVFTKLNLCQGYLQVPLHPDSRNLTAFVTHMGVFHYTRMPFGLSSAPSCFQKIMATIFAGVPRVVVCLDDVVVHQRTSPLHDTVLAEHNLTLNEEKCIFAAPATEFVGFRLTANGLSPLHSNVDVVLQLLEPSSPAQLFFPSIRTLLHRYVPSLNKIHPGPGLLRALLQSNSSSCSSPPCLCLPTFTS